MQINANTAMIDNDFLDHATSMEVSCDEITRILKEIFDELNVEPMIHPLVMQNEVLRDSVKIKTVFSQDIIKTPTLEDIHHNDPDRISYYSFLVLELYKKLTGYELEMGEATVFTFWKRRISLGEIHSLSACLLCGCGVFLSDDKDAKKIKDIIKESFNTDIAVHNRKAVVTLLREKGTMLSRRALQSFAHSAR